MLDLQRFGGRFAKDLEVDLQRLGCLLAKIWRSNCKGLEGHRFMARPLQVNPVTERINKGGGDELITGP